jgi:hypothetical protein
MTVPDRTWSAPQTVAAGLDQLYEHEEPASSSRW